MFASGRTTFRLSAAGPTDSDLLGIWNTPSSLEEWPASFDLGSTATEEAAVFLNDLPPDLHRASLGIDQANASLQTSMLRLDAAQERLDRLVYSQQAGVSFDVNRSVPDNPESQTLAMLASADPTEDWSSASFEVGEHKPSRWEQAAGEFQDFIKRLGQIVGHLVWVETQISGKLIVRSSVGWTGNLETSWNITPSTDLAALHQRTLALTLASRTAMLRTFGVVSAGAVKLSALVASPAGVLLALPAAWNFIRQVQLESARYTSIKEEIEYGK